MICDLCGAVDPIWKYRVQPVQGVVINNGRLENRTMPTTMMLCDDCSCMIEIEDRIGLQQKAINRIVTESVHDTLTPMNKQQFGLMVKQSVEGFQRMFWEIRDGERVYVGGSKE